MVEAAIGLGGNLGDREAVLREALRRLDGQGLRVARVSSLYETPPWGDPDQGAFLNACALVETGLAPRALLDRLLAIEREMGRMREKARRWGPRLIDLDLLWYGDATIAEPGLEVPHPRMFERAFVLVPLAEIAPDRALAGQRIADAAARLDSQGIRRIAPLA